MTTRLKQDLRKLILKLYEPSDRNALQASRILHEQGYTTSQSTVCRVWSRAGYQLRTRGETQKQKIRTTSCSDGVKTIIQLYLICNRDSAKTQEQLKVKGYQVTIKEIIRCWEIVNSYNRYGGNTVLAARSLPYSNAIIGKYWRLAGLREDKQKKLEERI